MGLSRHGPGYGPAGGSQGRYAIALIHVQTVVKGTPILGSDGLLRIPFMLVMGADRYPEKEFTDLQRSIPADPALLYLYSWADYFDLAGAEVPGWLDDLDDPAKYKTIGGDGAFRVVGGRVRSPAYWEGWPLDCDGLQIEAMITRIQHADGRPAASPQPAGSACS